MYWRRETVNLSKPRLDHQTNITITQYLKITRRRSSYQPEMASIRQFGIQNETKNIQLCH